MGASCTRGPYDGMLVRMMNAGLDGGLALHACCGPCLLEPYDALAETGERIVVVYANPNIHPAEEYVKRRDALLEYARERGFDLVELEYEQSDWLDAVKHASNRDERCRSCYRLRMRMVSRWAADNGYSRVATTLTVSPYQDPLAIAEEAERAAAEAGITYAGRDFRDRYSQATSRSRELGMYRQNYCGCLPSQIEARIERETRKRERSGKRVG